MCCIRISQFKLTDDFRLFLPHKFGLNTNWNLSDIVKKFLIKIMEKIFEVEIINRKASNLSFESTIQQNIFDI